MNWKTIFNPENDFFRTLSHMVDVVGLSLLWLFCCIPLVTIGSATAALYSTVLRCVRQEQEFTYLHFLRGFWQNLKAGIPLTLLFSLPALLLWYGLPKLAILGGHGDQVAAVFFYAWQFLILILLSYACLLFGLLARFESSLRGLLLTSVQLMVRHLPSTLLCGIGAYLSFALCWNFWYPILILPALTALILSFPLERIFLRYAPEENQDDIDSSVSRS